MTRSNRKVHNAMATPQTGRRDRVSSRIGKRTVLLLYQSDVVLEWQEKEGTVCGK